MSVVVLGLIAAACSSNSKSSTATTVAPSNGGATSSTSTASGVTSSGLATAKAFVAKYTQRPTQISQTTPISKPIPKGIKLYFVPCGVSQCQLEGQIVQQAGNLLGWTTTILPNNGSPEQTKADFQQAINGGANAILYTAVDESVFASLVPQMKAKNIVLSTCCNLYPAGTDQVIYDVDIPSQSAPVSEGLAAFVATLSNCQNADSVIVDIPDLTILNQGVTDYKQYVSQFCPSATVGQLNIALSNLATAPATIVSYVRAHPNVKYVVASTDSVIDGAPAAMKAAGLGDVRFIGQGAAPTNIQYLKSGEESGDVAFAYDENMYSMVDAVARYEAGVPVLPSTAPPLWLLTPQNAPTANGQIFPVVANFQAQYKKLWGLG